MLSGGYNGFLGPGFFSSILFSSMEIKTTVSFKEGDHQNIGDGELCSVRIGASVDRRYAVRSMGGWKRFVELSVFFNVVLAKLGGG